MNSRCRSSCSTIDDFKSINDRRGHPVGDGVLRAFARVLNSAARSSDVVCRVGGEEFAVVLGGASAHEAARFATRELEHTRLARIAPRRVSASAGVAAVAPSYRAGDELFKLADEGLLDAKRSGKNRVAIAEPT
jgi:diguanylate cyclase (GGDEF)-like protein